MKTNKRKIRLTESNLKNIIKESVKKILKESIDNKWLIEGIDNVGKYVDEAEDIMNTIRQILSNNKNDYDPQLIQDCNEIYRMLDNINIKLDNLSIPDDPDSYYDDFY